MSFLISDIFALKEIYSQKLQQWKSWIYLTKILFMSGGTAGKIGWKLHL